MWSCCSLPISRNWRLRWLVWVLYALEIAVTIAALALFAIASPDLYRTKLWKDGAANGFNSDPILIVLSYANYDPKSPPLVWSNFITQFNVVISVLSMFVMLVKAVMFIMHVFYPIFGFLSHGALMALYAYSVYGQTSGDHLDPERPVNGAPWYITKSCDVAHDKGNIHYCQQAKGCLAVAVLLLALFFFNAVLAAWSMVPTKKERAAWRSKKYKDEEEAEDEKGGSFPILGQYWDHYVEQQEEKEMQAEIEEYRQSQVPPTPRTPWGGLRSPMTPRTTAFHNLGGTKPARDLPLRDREREV